MQKAIIRREALSKRNAMSEEERTTASARICSQIGISELFQRARGIHIYKAIGSEVNLAPLIDLAFTLDKHVGMMVVLEDSSATQYEIDKDTVFEKHSTLNILQPVNAHTFDMSLCDLVIVPVVAFDESANRLGYGKGFYDHFLMHHPRPAFGAAFESQLYNNLPCDENDVQLDAVYTEQRIVYSEHNSDVSSIH